MPAIQTKSKKPSKTKSEAELLGEATRRLLKGIKEDATKKGKPLTRAELVRRGYTAGFIAQLEAA